MSWFKLFGESPSDSDTEWTEKDATSRKHLEGEKKFMEGFKKGMESIADEIESKPVKPVDPTGLSGQFLPPEELEEEVQRMDGIDPKYWQAHYNAMFGSDRVPLNETNARELHKFLETNSISGTITPELKIIADQIWLDRDFMNWLEKNAAVG